MTIHTGLDYDGDGELSTEDLHTAERVNDIHLREQKAHAHKQLAWTAMISMIIFTFFLFTPIISNDRIELLTDISSMFYVAQGSIVGGYMAVTTWMSRK